MDIPTTNGLVVTLNATGHLEIHSAGGTEIEIIGLLGAAYAVAVGRFNGGTKV